MSHSSGADAGPGDYDLGRRLARLVAQEGASAFEAGVANRRIVAAVQDLLGAETSLAAPLRDLLQRPGFRLLFSDERISQTVGARDALITDLGGTYSPAVVNRLAAVIHGCLGEPMGAIPHASANASQRPPAPPAAPAVAAYAPAASPPAPAMSMPVVAVQQPNNGLLGGLIALVSLLAGALVVGLAWALMLQRSPQQAGIPAPKQPDRGAEPAPAPAPRRPAAEPPKAPAAVASGISQADARSLVDEWLNVKQRIFAPPFDTDLADQLVAAGPLWTDLTKPDGSIQWLRNNNNYYSYNGVRINDVISFTPSETMPSLVVSVTEDSVLHSPTGSAPSTSTANWLYTFKEEGGVWKLWDYRKQ